MRKRYRPLDVLAAGAAAFVMAVVVPASGRAQAVEVAAEQVRDGAGDFDFEFGTWRTELRVLVAPLTGSKEWREFEGTSVVTPLLDGRSNVVDLKVEGPGGRIEGLNLRLYDPVTREWSLHFANVRTGQLSPPVIGRFENGRGEFHGQERIGDRTVLVRFVISDITPRSARFEQSFSDDGGRTWEVNWIAVDTRIDGDGAR